MPVIGVVEDDINFNQALSLFLTKEGYEIISATSLQEGRSLISQNPDLLLIDIGLPDGEGFDLCAEAHNSIGIPSIFLTARDEESDMLRAFDTGCDDYVVKPFPMQVLLKRIEAVLRRNSEKPDSKNIFVYHNLNVDFLLNQVSIGGEIVRLTAKEYKLLVYLIENRGRVVTKDQILDALWDAEGNFVEANTLNVTINRLRKKIEIDPACPIYIRNVFGLGYTFGE
ncbi:MAG: response regulator transcription factor [Clostridiales Family XIII bacterium]|nr:response regulator transcription factor [Clostridiales Family XIII bacterium]